MFEHSSIVNKNLDASSFSGTELNCARSGIRHTASISQSTNSWSAQLIVPLSLISSPLECPYPGYGDGSSPTVWRFNVYRIRLLQDTSVCKSSTCEYLAYSSTDVSPPSFHQPKHFAIAVMK